MSIKIAAAVAEIHRPRLSEIRHQDLGVAGEFNDRNPRRFRLVREKPAGAWNLPAFSEPVRHIAAAYAHECRRYKTVTHSISSFATVENSELQKHEFSSNIPVTYSHTGVGSGNTVIPYPDGSDYNNRVTYFFTSGTIVYRIGWAMNQGQILSLPESYWSNKW